MPIQANKAIVGTNAFSHSSGIHQDGVLKSQNTYEIMTPETVGLNTNKLNLTSRSGRHVIKHRMEELGYTSSDYDLDELYESFLRLADKKGQIFDYDLEALVLFSNLSEEDDFYSLQSLSVQSGSNNTSTATVSLQCGDEIIIEAAIGNGPVNSICSCISRITGYAIEIKDFKVASTSTGMDALGQVNIMAAYNSRNFHGMGLATDIIRSSAKALIHVVNDIRRTEKVAVLRDSNRKLNQGNV